jgi:hypothetical protein
MIYGRSLEGAVRKIQFYTFLAAAAFIVGLHPIASAQTKTCPSSAYAVAFDGCLHRFPWAVLQGCKEQRDVCPGQRLPPPKPAVYTLATPSLVTAAIVCDIAAAAKATKGADVDFSRAVISADITFSEVTKDSLGAKLVVSAIPVFSGASVTPSNAYPVNPTALNML